MDRGQDSRRKTKTDKRAKRRYKIYKTGGAQRSFNIKISGKQEN
jgi:hypothetical protein